MATINKRLGPKGRTVFQATIRVRGYRSVTKTFDLKGDARRWATETEAAMRAGRWKDTAAAERITVRELLARYREEVAPGLKGARQEINRLRKLECTHPCRDVALAYLTSNDISQWRDERVREAAAETVIKEMNLLHRVIERARKEWNIYLPENPVSNVRKPKRPQGRMRRLLPGEEARLLQAFRCEAQPGKHGGRGGKVHRPRNQWMEAAFILALETAMRRGELLGLCWADVDFEMGFATLHETKNGDVRQVPLTPRALGLLEVLPEAPDGRVIPLSAEALQQAWKRAVRRAEQSYLEDCRQNGIDPDPRMFNDLRWHDLRHEATSRFFEVFGFSAMEVAAITGHKDMRMLKRYTHLLPDNLAARMRKVAPLSKELVEAAH